MFFTKEDIAIASPKKNYQALAEGRYENEGWRSQEARILGEYYCYTGAMKAESAGLSK